MREEFEKAYKEKFGDGPSFVHHGEDIEPYITEGALWAAKWTVERCRKDALSNLLAGATAKEVSESLRQLAQELDSGGTR